MGPWTNRDPPCNHISAVLHPTIFLQMLQQSFHFLKRCDCPKKEVVFQPPVLRDCTKSTARLDAGSETPCKNQCQATFLMKTHGRASTGAEVDAAMATRFSTTQSNPINSDTIPFQEVPSEKWMAKLLCIGLHGSRSNIPFGSSLIMFYPL